VSTIIIIIAVVVVIIIIVVATIRLFIIIWRRPKAKVRMADLIFAEAARSRYANINHCNRFYPFTRGQLQQYDPELFLGIQGVWKEIARWGKKKQNVV
jgi:hypothetical protein